MNIFVQGWLHPKNQKGLQLMTGKGINFSVGGQNQNLDSFDFCISTDSFNTNLSHSKGIIFGPHVSLEKLGDFPNQQNFYFNTLSDWLKKLAIQIFGEKNFVALPFPVDVEMFKPAEKIGKPVLYFKRRKKEILESFLKQNKLEDFDFFDYERKYSEQNFLTSISRAPYAVWIGCHESQGFAFQETLSSGTPIFVIDAESLREETGGYWDNKLSEHFLKSTSASYFDERCGLLSTTNNWEEKFQIFLDRLHTFSPRDFVMETLSPSQCTKTWRKILDG